MFTDANGAEIQVGDYLESYMYCGGEVEKVTDELIEICESWQFRDREDFYLDDHTIWTGYGPITNKGWDPLEWEITDGTVFHAGYVQDWGI